MKAGPVTIRQLLENRQRFCVPIYQRHYVWTREKQWEPFWNDVRTKATERFTGRDRRFAHFMGALVLEARATVSTRRVTSYQVVDGQQRLTTFQLFLTAARHYAVRSGFTEIAERIAGFLFNDRPHLMENPEIEVLKVWPTKHDRELFQDILQISREELREKYRQHFYVSRDRIYPYRTVPNLLGSYGYFYDRIKRAVETDELEDDYAEVGDNGDVPVPAGRVVMELRLDAIWESLVEEFKAVEIILEEGDDAQVIFETLNDRSEPLLAADLVRNNIFYRADARNENAENLFSVYWTHFEDSFWDKLEKQGRYRKPRIELFLANFIAGKIAGEVTLSKLFSEYKAFIKKLENSSTDGYLRVEDELDDLARYGAIYRILLERSNSNRLGRFASQLHVWDVTTVFPLVLRLWKHNDLDQADKKSCLRILFSFIVRRAVCNLTTKNYNKYFLSVVRHLDKKGWSYSELARYLTIQRTDTARFPTNDEFHHSWISLPVYKNMQASRIRFVLESLERVKRQRFQETDQLSKYLSIEHVLPRNWGKNWPLGDGLEPTESDFLQAQYAPETDDTIVGRLVRRERLKHTFGNLTLLTQPLNSSVSNEAFDIKRDALAKHSLLVLNREIAQMEEWGEQQIEERGEMLFLMARRVWPYPGHGEHGV